MTSFRADTMSIVGPRTPWTDAFVPSTSEPRPTTDRSRVVGFFPGLGSRASYRDLGRHLLDGGLPAVAGIYRDAAEAMGYSDRPERLLMVPENLPEDGFERQGFIGAAFLVHGLALHAQLRALAEARRASLLFAAYAGESFGIIAAAVAGEALSCGDGVKIARAFTPLVMLAAEGGCSDEPFARSLAAHLPDSIQGRRLVAEPAHVVALKGEPEDLSEALAGLAGAYPAADVEVHKLYSRRQVNVYVRARAKPGFDMFMKNFAAVATDELKEPTTFLAHSSRMRGVRVALERFMVHEGIVFRDPRVPIIANHVPGSLASADEVRGAVLAMVDEAMASRTTAEAVIELRPDIVVELGLGGKSIRLLADNGSDIPAMSYAGTGDDADLLLGSVDLMADLRGEMLRLQAPESRLTTRHLDLLRALFCLAHAHPFCGDYLYGAMVGAIAGEMLRPDRNRSPAFYRLLEIFQHTYHHRRGVDVASGELICQAQSKRTIDDAQRGLGRVYADLKVIDGAGAASDRTLEDVDHPEVVVFHFESLAGLGLAELARNTRLLLAAQPSARQIYGQATSRFAHESGRGTAGTALHSAEEMASSHIVYQFLLFDALRQHRPALLVPNDYYVEGSDLMGWLVALAAAGASSLADVVALYGAYLRAGTDADDALGTALDGMLSRLRGPDRPVVSPAGLPVQTKKDLEATTRDLVHGNVRADAPMAGAHDLHLGGDRHIVSLGAAPTSYRGEAGPRAAQVISVRSPVEIWQRRTNPALDAFEELRLSTLTDDNEKVLRFAQGRKLLSSTVFSYLNIGERVVGFGKGGSESMTMFFTREAGFAG